MTEFYVVMCMTVEAPDKRTAKVKMEGWSRRVNFPDSVKDHEITLVEEAGA